MPGDAERLVSKERATGDLYVTYKNVKYENGVVTFFGGDEATDPGVSVNREQGTTDLAFIDKLSIRVIAN